MKEPTGDIEATLRYWQKRALQAEADVADLKEEVQYFIDALRYSEGMREAERLGEFDE